MIRIKTLAGLIIFACYGNITMYAQNNYWLQQYGAKSSLMAGAVVGGIEDNSALFYNPAGIGSIDSNNVNISANGYGFETVSLQNGAGTNLDLNSFRVQIYPQLVSGLIRFKKVPKLKMVYGLLTRYKSDIRTHVENRMNYDVIVSELGTEYYEASFGYEVNSIAQWAGLGLGYQLSPKVYVGLTNFISYQHYDDNTYTQASADVVQPGYNYTTTANTRNFNIIDHVSILWKAGMMFDFKKIKFGFAVTTPNVGIFGISRIGKSVEYFNQDIYMADSLLLGTNPTFILSDDRSQLPARLRTPLSISWGVEGNFPKSGTRIGLSFEYFFPIDYYVAAKSDSAVPVRPAVDYGNYKVNNFLVFEQEASGILNGAIGLEQRISKSINGYLGFRTDFNNATGLFGPVTNTRVASFSHYLHFSTGITYKKGASDITVGINYGLGIATLGRQPLNITEPGAYYIPENGNYYILQGLPQNNVSSQVHNVSLVLGYTYYFKKAELIKVSAQ